MLIGQVEGKVGEKHQAAFPKKYREVLGEKLIITKGPDKNLIVVSEENWKTLLEGTEKRPFIDKSARDMQTFLLGNAAEIVLDEQGRFVLPEYLRKYAEITKEIIYVGMNRYVQVWDKGQWDEYQEGLSKNIEKIAEKLSSKEEN